MEEIRKAAKAYYDNSSDEGRKAAKDWFRSMDKNGDGYISLQEFIMTCSDNTHTNNTALIRKLFNLLDKNGDGTLQFDEFITLVYLRASPRMWCDGCGEFIAGLFFSCTRCCLGRNGDTSMTYDLCTPCYYGKHFVHEHADFVDNYSLLAMMRNKLASSRSKIGGNFIADAAKGYSIGKMISDLITFFSS